MAGMSLLFFCFSVRLTPSSVRYHGARRQHKKLQRRTAHKFRLPPLLGHSGSLHVCNHLITRKRDRQ